MPGMAFSRRKSPVSAGIPILMALGCLILPSPSQAIPAFARKYNVKCYTCHTIPPALNKTGYIFKRLGYRLPPDEMDGEKPAPKILELENPEARFDITNALALVTQGSFMADKNTGKYARLHFEFQPGRGSVLSRRHRAADELLLFRAIRVVSGRKQYARTGQLHLYRRPGEQ